jgi:hypothetical protein
MSLKFSPQVQREILDEIVAKQQRYIVVGIDLSDVTRNPNSCLAMSNIRWLILDSSV